MKTLNSIFLASTIMAATFVASERASQAQGLNLSAVQSAVDPLTKLPPDQWITLATSLINGKAVVGKPMVYMINATGQELNSVICDNEWQLVGPKPYIKDAPGNLPAWKVTVVPTKGFDGYCRTAIVAQSDSGVTYKATLVSADGSFTNASFITFLKPAQ